MTGGGVHPSREDLFAYRDGELPAERRVLLEAHVMGCSVCRALVDEVSGLESALRRAGAEPGADYYETLPDAVLRRLGGAAAGEEGGRERGPRTARATRERRAGAAPRRPWAAVFSTAAAAAAVGVVVVVLMRGQRALSPLPPPVSEKREAPSVQPRAPGLGAVAPAESLAAAPSPAAPAPLGIAKSREKTAADSKAAPPAVGGEVGAVRQTAEPYAAKDQEREFAKREEAVAQEPSPTAARPAPAGVAPTAADQAVGARAPSAQEPSEAYAALARRFNLPPVWNERVSSETLRQAEPELRYIYQTGRAGGDSARVRLYLAEAARLRYVPGQDAELLEQITHHYLRAIRLSGADTAVAKIARERLSTLAP